MIATQLTVAIYQFVDALMVKSLGEMSLAAIAPAGMMIQIPLTFGLGLVATVTTFVSNAHGGKSKYLTTIYAWVGIFIALAMGGAVLSLWPFSANIMNLFPTDIGVFEKAVNYFRISLLSIAPQLLAAAIGGYFLGIDKPYIPLYSALLGSASNVFFNYGLMFGKFGAPELGFVGAAWGTVLASLTGAAAIFIAFLLEKHPPVWPMSLN
jgi:multidrug resistance protein, MATE family